MDSGGYQIPEELAALRDQVGNIIREEIIPIEARIDPDAAEIPEDGLLANRQKNPGRRDVVHGRPARVRRRWPRHFRHVRAHRGDGAASHGPLQPRSGVFGRTPPPVIYAGTEEQKRNYAGGTIKNAWHTFFAITEPSGGSDPAGAIQCSAVRQGDTYVLNGTKIFISHAHEAEWGVVFTRTDPKAGRKGITCFIIKKGSRRIYSASDSHAQNLRRAQRSPVRRLRRADRAAPWP